MKRNLKKVLSVVLTVVILVSLWTDMGVNVDAADTKEATIINIGQLGTVTIGDKKETGVWLKTEIGGKPVFCLDLGKACHTGYVYESQKSTISSESKDVKTSMKAKIGYWYYSVKEQSNKAWLYAQCLIWAVEEGITDREGLTDVISQVKKNTGYYNDEKLYSQIFDVEDAVECKIITWTYAGKGDEDYIQRLMEIDAPYIMPEYDSIHLSKKYYQSIRIVKLDEDGKPVPHTKFRIKAKNYKQLQLIEGNDINGVTKGDDGTFEMVLETDENGIALYEFTYQVQSRNYYYYFEGNTVPILSETEKNRLKSKLDNEGYSGQYDEGTLSELGARMMAEKELNEYIEKIKNEYVIEEISSGNKNIAIKPEYDDFQKKYMSDFTEKGVTITLDNAWTGLNEDSQETYTQYVVNPYKKVSFEVKKEDNYAADGKEHGDTELDGAVYIVYEDKECSKIATLYNQNGEETDGVYEVKNGRFVTDYLRAGKTYYLKEAESPEGYLISNEVIPLNVSADSNNEELSRSVEVIGVKESPILGKVAIQKILNDGSTGEVTYEEGAEFRIYLKSAGSYENADEYEKDVIVTDEKGYGITKNLYYGEYVVEQLSTGKNDSEKVKDFTVNITENEKTYSYILNDAPFKAYLKIVKKDKDTQKQVLKSGTTFQIYKKNSDGEEVLYKQTYSNGNKLVTVDKFVTDETGTVMTVKPLESGSYRIYETDAAAGFYIKDKYIDIEVNSNADNCIQEIDADGNPYMVITAEYENNETTGLLTVVKTGEKLMDFQYERNYLKGIVFEIYADEDIVTQDNQGTILFDKGSKVASLTTGKGAEFTNECNGLCTYNVDGNTSGVTITLPLGKYVIKEVKTEYGYVLDKSKEWKVEFNWEGADRGYVFDVTGNCDSDGVLLINNDRAKTDVSIVKKDATTELGVKDAVFGLYTKDDIYSEDGKVMARAGELLTTVITDENGYAGVEMELPLKSQNYNGNNGNERGLNSGDYYFMELDISESYYIDKTEIPIHLEYQGQDVPMIKVEALQRNIQTETEIAKLDLSDSKEITGCHLVVVDKNSNEIVKWTSGDKNSIIVNDRADELGYRNLRAEINDKGNIVIFGLLQNEEYILVETKPADGYTTAENVRFKIEKKIIEDGSILTEVYMKDGQGGYVAAGDNKVVMYDDVTKIVFYKRASDTDMLLAGTKFDVYDSKGNKILSFVTSDKEPVIIRGILKVGETYKFVETEAPEGYEKEIVFVTVMDSSEIQNVDVVDRKEPQEPEQIERHIPVPLNETPKQPIDTLKLSLASKSPKTGVYFDKYLILTLLLSAIAGIRSVFYLRKV